VYSWPWLCCDCRDATRESFSSRRRRTCVGQHATHAFCSVICSSRDERGLGGLGHISTVPDSPTSPKRRAVDYRMGAGFRCGKRPNRLHKCSPSAPPPSLLLGKQAPTSALDTDRSLSSMASEEARPRVSILNLSSRAAAAPCTRHGVHNKSQPIMRCPASATRLGRDK
jgi:hypothetical protein